jgi:hypothetical protein
MSKSTFTLTIIGLFFLAVSSVLFIHRSNDHKECNTEVTTVKNSSGQQITSKQHICKEKYNF